MYIQYSTTKKDGFSHTLKTKKDGFLRGSNRINKGFSMQKGRFFTLTSIIRERKEEEEERNIQHRSINSFMKLRKIVF